MTDEFDAQPDPKPTNTFQQQLDELRASVERQLVTPIAQETPIKWSNALATPSGIVLNRHLRGYFSASIVWTPGSVAAGAQVTTTVVVTGAALGDPVIGASLSASLAGQQLTGYVSAANTVTVVLRNGTAGAIDLASPTLRVQVLKHTT